ncbi:MAG: hypothetical protein CSA11_04785 [Chloroflexi bacterium]|nr:MAG: hypothetical protein CSA11_04785 [Chloroflexota bacterium]
MFKERVEAVKYNGWLGLVIVPLIVSLIIMNQGLPLLVQVTGILVLKIPMEESLVSTLSVFAYTFSLILSIILAMLVGKLKLKDLGLPKENAGKDILKGAIGGFLAIALVSLLINVLGGVNTEFIFKSSFVGTIMMGLVMFIFQSTFEEFVYRSYLIPHLSKKFGALWAIFVTAVLFVILHASNGGMGVIPVINLFLAGVVFGLLYYLSGSLWLCGIAHALWNFSQGMIFGSLVSGNVLNEAVLKATPVSGMEIISGGAFGFEGSIVTSTVGIIIIIALIIRAKKQKEVIE